MPGTLLLKIALTHLKGRTRQTLLSILGVMTGVGFYIAMASMMVGFQQFFVQTIINVTPHIVMHDEFRQRPPQPVAKLYDEQTAALELKSLKPKEEVHGIRTAEQIVGALENTPGLYISPTLEGQIVFRYGTTDSTASLIGIDPKRERRITKLESDMMTGTLNDLLTHANGVILGDGLAKDLGARMGDTLSAISVAGIVKKMKVVGIFHTGITAMDNMQAYALLKQVQILEDRPNVVNNIRFALDDPQNASLTAQRIESRFLYKTESWQEANEGIMSVFVIQDMIRYATTGAILIVACFGIFNIISTVINEKARDIAILKSIGFTESDIQLVFLFQGLLTGVTGMVLGWGMGYGLSRLLEILPVKMENIITTDHLFIVYELHHYIEGGIACVVAASLASWLPARKAAALRPVEIIRGAA